MGTFRVLLNSSEHREVCKHDSSMEKKENHTVKVFFSTINYHTLDVLILL